MSLAIHAKLGQPRVLTLIQDDKPWRDVHVSIFGKEPVLTIETFPKIEYEKARIYALRKLAQKNHSSFELEKRLKACLVSESTIKRIIAEFVQAGYIDDDAWVGQFIKYLLGRKHGPAVIRQKLLLKGIDRNKADSIVAGLNTRDSLESVLKLLNSKYKNRNFREFKEKQKVIGALMRKGFDFDLINQAFSVLGINS